MQKKIEDGKVAVLYSPGYGAGWYSWHDISELLYDPIVVDMVTDNTAPGTIELYCKTVYGDHYYGGASDLEVIWLPQGTQFIINEYDGNEILTTKDEIQWKVA
jgi:hypothetical protein